MRRWASFRRAPRSPKTRAWLGQAVEQLGARPIAVCRLSGLRAGATCPVSSEWFLPGHSPGDRCDWHGANGLVLPARYADWAQQARVVVAGVTGERSAARAPGDTASARFRITSPAAGDVYRFVPGVELRYATIGLRAVGAPGAARVRWFVDGRAVVGSRLPLVPGKHRVRADAGKQSDEVAIEVVP